MLQQHILVLSKSQIVPLVNMLYRLVVPLVEIKITGAIATGHLKNVDCRRAMSKVLHIQEYIREI